MHYCGNDMETKEKHMSHYAKIIADSVSPGGVRLTTMELRYPRIVHAEMMTHRVFSRNAASSRAIPVEKMIRMVQEDPYIPQEFGTNQRGMQAGAALSGYDAERARTEWLQARDNAVYQATKLLELGVHKQLTNRLLEPFQWYTAIFTGTEWDNFRHLRCHEAAHPDIRAVATLISEQLGVSQPAIRGYGDWHRPYIFDEDVLAAQRQESTHQGFNSFLNKVSVGRCARVSYLTHDGKRDPEEDAKLHDRLLASGHLSPFEHVARPAEFADCTNDRVEPHEEFYGNFRGWVQRRKTIPYEDDILGSPQATEG